MGNLFAECRRCSIEQCELCAEVLPRRPRDQHQGSGLGAQSSSPNSGGARHSPGVAPWLEGDGNNPANAFRLHQEFQPSNMSEAEAFRLAQQMSLAGMPQRPEDMANSGGLQRLVEDGHDPALLHAAIMASHQHNPNALREPRRPLSEEEALAQAIRATKNEEETRQRARLIDEQRSEYEESLLIDKAKQEERLHREREEEERRKAEDEMKSKADLEEKARIDRVATLIEEARARLKDEPPKEEKSRVMVKVGTPQGKSLKRAFRSDDKISQIYDYVIVEGGEEFAFGRFCLLQQYPKTTYEDREKTLQAAGLQGQCALLVQTIESDDEEEADPSARKPGQACLTESTSSQTPQQESGSARKREDPCIQENGSARNPEARVSQEPAKEVEKPVPSKDVPVAPSPPKVAANEPLPAEVQSQSNVPDVVPPPAPISVQESTQLESVPLETPAPDSSSTSDPVCPTETPQQESEAPIVETLVQAQSGR